MPEYHGAITLYEHDSECCTYLGMSFKDDGPYQGSYDLFVCLNKSFGGSTLLARYSDDGPDYYSGTCFAAENRNPVLWEASKRAIALGLMTQEEVDREINPSSYWNIAPADD